MKIEVGKEYKVLVSALGFKKGNIISVEDEDVNNKDNFCIVVNRFENKRTPKKYIQMLELELYEDVSTESGEEKDEFKTSHTSVIFKDEPTSKPDHYDISIDTITFAKANFTPEQVKGFLRISAIECLQPNEGYNLESLNKASQYIQELISMENK